MTHDADLIIAALRVTLVVAAVLAALAFAIVLAPPLPAPTQPVVTGGPAAGGEPDSEPEQGDEEQQGPAPYDPLTSDLPADDTEAYPWLADEVEDYLRKHAERAA